MSRFLIALVAAIAILATFGGIRFWQEASYGRGEQASSSEVTSPNRQIAFVANAVGGSISMIDVESRTVIGKMNIVPDGTEVGFFRDPVQWAAQGLVEGQGGLNYAQDTDVSRDGRVLFVSRGFLADVAAFDLATGDLLWRTPIAGLRADHMALSPDGERLVVSALIRSGDVAEVLDTRTGQRLGSFQTGRWPHDVHFSKDGNRIYVASLGDMEKDVAERGNDTDAYLVTVNDMKTLERLQTHSFDAGVRPFVVTEDETAVYAQLSNTHAVIHYDPTTREQVARIDLPVADGVTREDWDFEAPHHGLALSDNEEFLCVAGRASDYAAILDRRTLGLQKTVPVGNAPSWSMFVPDSDVCLVANTRSDDVSFVSATDQNEAARVPVGRGAKHISIGRVPEDVLVAIDARR